MGKRKAIAQQKLPLYFFRNDGYNLWSNRQIAVEKMLGATSVGYYSLALNMMWCFVLQAIIDSPYPTIMLLYNSGNKVAFEKKN